MSGNELKKRLITLMEEGNFPYIGAAEKILDEAKQDFGLIPKHLDGLGIESPYVNSIIEKWFGSPEP